MGTFFSKKSQIITTKTYIKNVIPSELRQIVWNTYRIDEKHCPCYVCGTLLINKGWHCSHVQAEVKGGRTELVNLRVCCAYCNLSMGDLNLYCYIHNKIVKGVKLNGPGVKNYQIYLHKHPHIIKDKRTNNWRAKA